MCWCLAEPCRGLRVEGSHLVRVAEFLCWAALRGLARERGCREFVAHRDWGPEWDCPEGAALWAAGTGLVVSLAARVAEPPQADAARLRDSAPSGATGRRADA